MCQHIVGTEDYVKQVRLMNAVRDHLCSNDEYISITSGSYGEGLGMRGSDLDVMSVNRKIEVYNVKPHFFPNLPYLLMDTDDVKPGFTQLKLENNSRRNFSYTFYQLIDKHYLSSALWKQGCLTRNKEYTSHGPCIFDKNGLYDFVECFHCKTLVPSAIQWITRSTNSWPSNNVKQNIIKHGVLFVPIGVKGSPKEDLEWRISFSIGEKLLVNTFTHTQLCCYALIKILLKDVITTFSECKELLCSYFLKTILFWVSEELSQSAWKPDNLIPCFMQCFNRLIYCVEYSICLHYFIPENNMFANKIEGRALVPVFNLLGITLQILGDTESARQVFKQSVEIFPDSSKNLAVKRLMLMS
ncbi:cyclic GMP-AMP synthase-like receptor [Mytilus edulis]|uniref:cyclic GMP-AMP synthase-like receptor n=1 Tax=Mytilus edulis TaxID=6550 RepID=UPI0039EF5B26